jgi:hypothetical protein
MELQVAQFTYFRYDPAGNMIKEYWEFSDSWSQTFVYQYEEIKDD